MKNFLSSFFGAVIFYTVIQLPKFIPVNFLKIARWIAWIGVIIGIFLGFIDGIATVIDFPNFTKTIIVISFWIYITGGLHLDGVMDTADGLAVQNPQKRLKVMQDSVTGAFGVMAGIIIILLKVFSLSEITEFRWFIIILATSWGRWGQLMAISFYPYLRKEGKGAFLKQNLTIPQDLILGTLFIIPLILIQTFYLQQSWWLIGLTHLDCAFIALFVGWWFNINFKGHTGDTYGATVEWSEAIVLCFCTVIFT